jgi:hypothetical protein
MDLFWREILCVWLYAKREPVWTTEESLFDSLQGQELLYLFSKPSKPAVGPTEPPVQWLAATDFVYR